MSARLPEATTKQQKVIKMRIEKIEAEIEVANDDIAKLEANKEDMAKSAYDRDMSINLTYKKGLEDLIEDMLKKYTEPVPATGGRRKTRKSKKTNRYTRRR
jgi:hypothetical protein